MSENEVKETMQDFEAELEASLPENQRRRHLNRNRYLCG